MSDEERRRGTTDLVEIITKQNDKISELTGKVIFETGNAISSIQTTLEFIERDIKEIKGKFEKITDNATEIVGIRKTIKLATYIVGVLFTAAISYAIARASSH